MLMRNRRLALFACFVGVDSFSVVLDSVFGIEAGTSSAAGFLVGAGDEVSFLFLKEGGSDSVCGGVLSFVG